MWMSILPASLIPRYFSPNFVTWCHCACHWKLCVCPLGWWVILVLHLPGSPVHADKNVNDECSMALLPLNPVDALVATLSHVKPSQGFLNKCTPKQWDKTWDRKPGYKANYQPHSQADYQPHSQANYQLHSKDNYQPHLWHFKADKLSTNFHGQELPNSMVKKLIFMVKISISWSILIPLQQKISWSVFIPYRQTSNCLE